jgi:20S proteasome subunit beta 5
MAGGAADCMYWERELGMRARLYQLQNKRRISVSAASKMLANRLYSYKGYGLSVGTMIAGWDNLGPGLHYVDSDGTRLKGNLFSVGSGSTYAYGILDAHYKYDMTPAEAQELGRRAIYHATHRDAYSGGIINVYWVREDGWEFISADDTYDLHYEQYLGAQDAAPIETSSIDEHVANAIANANNDDDDDQVQAVDDD